MLYDDAKVNVLIDDLGKYHTTISTERQNAMDAANKLLAEAWQSGDGGAADAFKQKHNTLMTDLDDLLRTLATGKQHVADALQKAKSTDTKVANDFTW
ncbi:hypothetical protein OHB26_21485 [Nocardia sp. NBC_01503]|uniref:hypothetical protein n=1 Tax=Nocardia sp. NBC_01503 TaxID=2975997 RepID=UPI002E7AE0B7|nr:hypothetical protein [Nocardia sp. NBC_01503]WTL29559.1 hypothetical protein OHB26_21485 [Nocardia sp. NBC_01503]